MVVCAGRALKFGRKVAEKRRRLALADLTFPPQCARSVIPSTLLSHSRVLSNGTVLFVSGLCNKCVTSCCEHGAFTAPGFALFRRLLQMESTCPLVFHMALLHAC
jgi:hypothetical protein